MRGKCSPLLVLLVGVIGCHSSHRIANVIDPEPEPIAVPFQPERARRAVDGQPLPQVRQRLAGLWKFRVTVVGAVQDVSVGYFADRGDPASTARTGVISVRLPKDAEPGQTWEVEAEIDFDHPVLWEQGLLVWRFAKPISTIRIG